MEIKFSKFVNIGKGRFSAKTPLTILIGDNGVGKTLLLEAYSKTNDFFMEKILKTNFIDKIIDKANLDMSSLIHETLPYVKNNKTNRDVDIVDDVLPGSSIIFRFNSSISNIDELKRISLLEKREVLKELEKVLKTEILFSDESDEVMIDNFTTDILIPIDDIDKELSFDLTLSFPVVEDNFDKKDRYQTDLFSDREDTITIDFGKNNFYGRISSGTWITREESKEHKDSLLNGDYTIVSKLLKRIITDVLVKRTAIQNNISPITYIPSERIVSMSDLFYGPLADNSKMGLRYSEEKFAKEYLYFQENYPRLSNKMKRTLTFDKEYVKLLEGNPKFDKNGVVTGIVDDNNNLIDRSLFSTKQNKLYPFFLLNQSINTGYAVKGNRHLPYYLSRDKVIIIEEPESNLSIKGIKEMANYIYELNKTYRIIISTHSDIFLTELNNLYLDNSKTQDVSGFEIISKVKPYLIKKLEVSNRLGVSSDFMTSQLELLYERTQLIQNEKYNN